MKRLDQFGYRRLGAKSRWLVGEAVDVLTCLEMEVNQSYDNQNPRELFDKLYDMYWAYVTDSMVAGKLPYLTDYTDDDYNNYKELGADVKRSIRERNTSFNRDTLLKLLEEDVLVRVDLHRLRAFLSGAENLNVDAFFETASHGLSSETVRAVRIGALMPADGYQHMTIAESDKDNALAMERTDSDRQTVPVNKEAEDVSTQPKARRYYFVKTGNVWNIQYETASLTNIKNWTGMAYIKVLLENPGKKIGVLDLQALAGGDADCEQFFHDYTNLDGESAAYGCDVSEFEPIDDEARKSYRSRLETIKLLMDDARERQDEAKINALHREAEIIGKELQLDRFKPKDPEVEKNRKRVRKSIEDAIAGIKKLEAIAGYQDFPISSHLKRSIRKGSFCSYEVESDKQPDWEFY